MRLVLGHGQEPLGLEFIRSAETAVGLAFREQPFGVLGVDGQALGLAIGSEVAGFGLARRTRAFIPVNAEPVQVFDQLSLEANLGALQIRVFNAEQELAPGAAREEPVLERSAGIAYVEQAGGRRGEPDTGSSVRHGNKHDRR
jgi:hypothetical protein